jgi:hypothetical protein
MEYNKKLNYFINHYNFDFLAQQFLEDSIDRIKLFAELGIKDEDFYGIIGEDGQDHLFKALCKDGHTTPQRLLVKSLEQHIRRHGRFHDDLEKPKKLTAGQKRGILLKDMEAALKVGNQDKYNALSLELAKEQEKELERLNEIAGCKNSWERVY